MKSRLSLVTSIGLLMAGGFMLTLGCSAGSDGRQIGGGKGGSQNHSSGGTSNGIGGQIPISSGGTGSLEGCAGDRYDGKLVPLDILVALDKSGSMQDDGKWGQVMNALNGFIDNVPGDGVSIGFTPFPVDWHTNPNLPAQCQNDGQCGAYGPCLFGFNQCNGGLLGMKDSCIPTDYHADTQPFVLLPGGASAAKSYLSGLSPNGDSTPIVPALKGAHLYAEGYAKANPNHQVVVVLAADGEPNNCMGNTQAEAQAVAQAGLSGSPSIRTYAIGIGELSYLNSIAQAGGTGQAFIAASSNAAQEFIDAMNEIRGAIKCQYQIPIPAEGEQNPNLVNVGVTEPGKDLSVIPRVDGPGSCGGEAGWYYDNPSNPNQIILCPASCDVVEYSEETVVDVVIGCEVVVK